MGAIESFIASEFTSVFTKCILRFAEKYKSDHANVYVLLALNAQGEPVYRMIMNQPGKLDYPSLVRIPEGHVPTFVEEINIKQVLDVRYFHIKGYDQLGPPYIQKSLIHLAEQNNLGVENVSVLICTNTQDVFLFLCKWDPEHSNYCQCPGGAVLVQDGPPTKTCKTCGKQEKFLGSEKFKGGITYMLNQLPGIEQLF